MSEPTWFDWLGYFALRFYGHVVVLLLLCFIIAAPIWLIWVTIKLWGMP